MESNNNKQKRILDTSTVFSGSKFWIEPTNLTFCEVARSLSFKCEKHLVTTKDGY